MALSGGAAALPGTVLAQSPDKMLRVGTANVQPRSAPQWVAFERRMAERGYVDGRNFNYDHVQIGNAEAWESVYREVVARKPDIVVAAGPEQSLKAAIAAAGTLPIVMAAVDYDPLARGYIAGLAKPGGNVSGVYFQNTELAAKHLQLVKDMSPGLTTVTVLWDQLSANYWAALLAAAPQAGVKLAGVELLLRPYDYEATIAGLAPADRKCLIAIASPFFFLDRARLSEVAISHRMVLMTTARETIVAGGLMSYGANLNEMWALAADYVDRIAKGAKPADLAVQQPTKFELIINLKTAAALGLTVPPILLAQADEVIE